MREMWDGEIKNKIIILDLSHDLPCNSIISLTIYHLMINYLSHNLPSSSHLITRSNSPIYFLFVIAKMKDDGKWDGWWEGEMVNEMDNIYLSLNQIIINIWSHHLPSISHLIYHLIYHVIYHLISNQFQDEVNKNNSLFHKMKQSYFYCERWWDEMVEMVSCEVVRWLMKYEMVDDEMVRYEIIK